MPHPSHPSSAQENRPGRLFFASRAGRGQRRPPSRARRIYLGFVGILRLLVLLVLGALVWSEGSTYLANSRVQGVGTLESIIDSKSRLLVISPHPDDETLGAGGLLARAAALKIPVRVIFLTNGDASRTTQLYRDFQKSGFSSTPQSFLTLAPARQAEAGAALGRLGLASGDLRFLGYPDCGLYAMWQQNWSREEPFRSPTTGKSSSPYANSPTPGAPYAGTALVEDLKKQMEEFDPTLILTTHSADTHPDHATAYDLALAAREQILWQQGVVRYIPIRTFLVHHGFWPAPTGHQQGQEMQPPAVLTTTQGFGGAWLRTALSPKEIAAKRAALDQYASQLATTPLYLDSFVRKSELFAEMHDSITPFEGEKVALSEQPVAATTWQKLQKGADVQQIQIENGKQGGTQLRIKLVGEPGPAISFQVVMHHVAARSGQISLQKWAVTPSGSGYWLSESSGIPREDGRAVSLAANQLIVPLPASATRPGSLILSVTSRRGNLALDKTLTSLVRFGRPGR